MRVIGLDLGDKTIGVAVSDPSGLIAQGIKTIKRKNIKYDIDEIIKIVNEYNAEKIIMGLPKNMNGTMGSSSQKVIEFSERIKKHIDIEIIFQDERLTTVSAQRILIEADLSREKRKKVVDTVAATYILQTYLDSICNS
ncbi:MAG TPA: Holliday junction resolvase RuvX [Clostridiaceae bacterium]|jgi:putative Holliday junction resolvase|nr:Holliday junction resolvase RuvX [Clostridiaceae bacterium]HBG39685.1 Holliday junction resolvase RuvX [Clostridiaceae bacterium]HBN29624.1 Holliday junction resolvase RuvX [Clostridiaceae bacterium]HBX48619.1 Holliday junction resolvase RuvX [Clostridiaceae bacterium]HCL49609.1 Holliday junction resolvase RuvX [Clostridiaceae bacterium]